MSALPRIQAFIGAFASRNGWDGAMAERLHAVCEESLLVLLEHEEDQASRPLRHLLLAARRTRAGPSSNSLSGRERKTFRIGWRCLAIIQTKHASSAKFHFGCCGTWRHRFTTSNFAAMTF